MVGNRDHDVSDEIDANGEYDGGRDVESRDRAEPDVTDANVGGGGEADADADAVLTDLDARADAGVDAGVDAGADAGAPPIAFVQVASRDTRSSVATVSATYANPQHAGNVNIVVIGWGDPTNTIRAVADSAGNTYALAAPPVSTHGVALAVYYAANIAATPSNTVTVSFDIDDYPCLAILEYSGVSRVDNTASGKGSSATASTNSVVTSAARELVLGAGEPDQNGTANFENAGNGFHERVITSVSGMLVEDLITSQTGDYAASGTLTSASSWVMHVVAFE